jgi:hypothetical protein
MNGTRSLLVLGILSLTACSGAAPDDSAGASDVPVWEVSADPTLQIGEVEGAAEYLMHQLVSSVALPVGRVALLNAGSHEVRIFDGNAAFVGSFGGQGEGPGEFRRPGRLYRFGDTLVVFDEGATRLSLHTLDGAFIEARPLTRERGRMQWDEWLHDRSWIDGPPLGIGRESVVEALRLLPPPDSTEGYRYLHATDFGHLWVRQPMVPGAGTREWHIFDLRGNPLGRVQLPSALELHEIGADHLLGRATDSLGVEYFQRYGLDTRWAVIEHRAASLDESGATMVGADSTTAVELRGVLRMLGGAQEVYYADPENGYQYADDHRKLPDFVPPEGIDVRIVRASARGFRAVAMDRETGAMCGMATEAVPPVGWLPGVAMCL